MCPLMLRILDTTALTLLSIVTSISKTLMPAVRSSAKASILHTAPIHLVKADLMFISCRKLLGEPSFMQVARPASQFARSPGAVVSGGVHLISVAFTVNALLPSGRLLLSSSRARALPMPEPHPVSRATSGCCIVFINKFTKPCSLPSLQCASRFFPGAVGWAGWTEQVLRTEVGVQCQIAESLAPASPTVSKFGYCTSATLVRQ